MDEPEILYEDEDIIAVAKPAGMFVHASPGHEKGTLAQWLVERFPEMADVGSVQRPGIVHRLDAETSGVMVAARTQRAYAALRKMFEAHAGIVKRYLAVMHGAPEPKKGTVRNMIGRKPWDRIRMAVGGLGGKVAVSHYETLAVKGGVALVEWTIETGRTHQIRVHAAHLGHPVAGDTLYGDAAKDARMRRRPQRQLLHAVQLEMRHPFTGEMMVVTAPVPEDVMHCI